MPDDVDPRVKLAYDESVRGLDMQSAALDELRNRTGLLIAAATVASAFLGAAALAHQPASYWVNICGFLAFFATILLCLAVLWPSEDWDFVYNADDLLSAYLYDTIDATEMHRSMAEGNAESRAVNRTKLRIRYRIFRFACGGLALNIFLWLIAVGVR